MDQTDIRGLVTDTSSFRRGAAYTLRSGIIACDSHVVRSRIPLIGPAHRVAPPVSWCRELYVRWFCHVYLRCVGRVGVRGQAVTVTWRPMSQSKPVSSRAMATQILFTC